MKTIADVILFCATLAGVFFVAGLSDVPRRVRWSVVCIPIGFMLTFLLHWRHTANTDYGLAFVSVALVASAGFGFHHTNQAPLSREKRLDLAKRFATIFALSAIAVAIVTALILGMDNPSRAAEPVSDAPVSTTAAVGDSTEQAIRDFNNYKSPYND